MLAEKFNSILAPVLHLLSPDGIREYGESLLEIQKLEGAAEYARKAGERARAESAEREAVKAEYAAIVRAEVRAESEKTRAEFRAGMEETRRAIAQAGRQGKDYAARVAAFREFGKRLQDEGGTQAEIAKGLLQERPLAGAGGKPLGGGAFVNAWRQWCEWGRPDAAAYGARLADCRRGHKGA